MKAKDWHEFRHEHLAPYHERKRELAEKQKAERAAAWEAHLKQWEVAKKELEKQHQEEREQFQSDWNNSVKHAAQLWEEEKKVRAKLREAGVDIQAELENFVSTLPDLTRPA